MALYFRFSAKIFLIFLFLAGFHRESHAQDYYGSTYTYKPVSLGITFAPNMSWHRYGTGVDIEKKWEIGYGYGLLADFGLSENYYLATGFLINNLKSTVDVGPDQLSTTYRTQYVEVPFGITGGERIAGDKEIEDMGRQEFEVKTYRLCLAIGGGIEWQLDHKLSMVIVLTFNNGFTEILDDGYGKPKDSYLAFNFAIFF